MNPSYVTYEYQQIPHNILVAWSMATHHEEFLLTQTVEELHENVLYAVIAFVGGRPVGFSGLVVAHTRNNQAVTWRGRRVVELGGAYIAPMHRGKGIWRRVVELRLAYARAHDWLAVCITGNATVRKGLAMLEGARLIDHVAERGLLESLCLDCEPAASCPYCPLKEGAAWCLT